MTDKDALQVEMVADALRADGHKLRPDYAERLLALFERSRTPEFRAMVEGLGIYEAWDLEWELYVEAGTAV
jgi:hypothetical protein